MIQVNIYTIAIVVSAINVLVALVNMLTQDGKRSAWMSAFAGWSVALAWILVLPK